jgi:AcrR family transcriptional regulator
MNVHSTPSGAGRKRRDRGESSHAAPPGPPNPAPAKAGRRARPKVHDKRRSVLDAATTLFAQRGYHGTTVPDVAAAARIATGTLYHYFADKEQLVNEVYRDAKLRLRAALLDGLASPAIERPGALEAWFLELWRRLADFARREPDAFRFLEMQDHVAYLDAESRRVEIATLAPIYAVASRVEAIAQQARADVIIALVWGAFVGLVKATRLGYLALEDAGIDAAGALAWRLLAPESRRVRAARPEP